MFFREVFDGMDFVIIFLLSYELGVFSVTIKGSTAAFIHFHNALFLDFSL